MSRYITSIALSGSLLLGGCTLSQQSTIPVGASYPINQQQVMQAAHHWDILAKHQAEMIREFTEFKYPLYVKQNTDETPFNKTFSQMLTSQLVQAGASVKVDPEYASEVSYTVNLVKHVDRKLSRDFKWQYTALAGGLGAAYLIGQNWTEPGLALLPAAFITDVLDDFSKPTEDHEVVITTQVTNKGHILYSGTSIYYTLPGEQKHYADKPPKKVMMTNQL